MISLAYHKHRMDEAKQLELAWRERCAALEEGLRTLLDACTGGANRAVFEASIKAARDALKGGKGKRK